MKKFMFILAMLATSFAMQAQESESPQVAFLNAFYKTLQRDLLDYNYVKGNVTPKAYQQLVDGYDYDCEGECLATWMFLYEAGGDTGAMENKEIKEIDANTYSVKCIYEGYEYVVELKLVEEGNTYKIDNIKMISSEYF